MPHDWQLHAPGRVVSDTWFVSQRVACADARRDCDGRVG